MFFIVGLLFFNYLVISCDRTNNQVEVFDDNRSNKACAENKIPNEFIVQWKSGKISKVDGMSQQYFVNDFLTQNLDQVVKAEPNYRITVDSSKISTQNSCNQAGWHHEDIQSQAMWGKGHFGDNVVIAVTDTGIDFNNPELFNSIAKNPGEVGVDENGNDKETNNIDDDNNGYVDDVYGLDALDQDMIPNDEVGHGTAVTSTIVAKHDHPFLKGIAPNAKIIPIKFLDNFRGSTATAVKAIEYAILRGADIINASWGGNDSTSCSTILPDFLKTIEQKQTILVAASGNGDALGRGLNLDIVSKTFPIYPASANLKNQITVGSISPLSKKRSSFSNYGENSVELFAPGSQILTQVLDSKMACEDGTSFSAPLVSGTLALVMNAYPDLNPIQIKKVLLDSTKKDKDFRNLTSGTLDLQNIISE